MAAELPLPKFHFVVEWGAARAGFTEISGLEVETEVIEYRDGASPEFSKKKFPGLRKFTNIALKRGLFATDNAFFDWWKQNSLLHTAERRDVTISLLNETHEPVVVWKVRNAFPVKLTSTDLKGDASEAAIETMELAHEGLEIENG